ncbi:MAG: hypothetical protein Q8S21_01035 [Candidatus Paracaedibacteraceae bacterium]|nr:hypothetical protein [Candidatus Paracaedibacteraceae bacterium]
MIKTYGIQTINDLDFCKEALVEAQASLLTDGIPIAVLCVWLKNHWARPQQT